MAKFVICVLVYGLCSVANSWVVKESKELIDIHSIVETVNSINRSWTAAVNFEELTLEQARCLTGVIRENVSQTLPPAPHLLGFEEDVWLTSAPTNFDARKAYSGCIASIRNQGQCGSCWAFGAASALGDRLCIYSKRSLDVILSPQQMVSCDSSSYGMLLAKLTTKLGLSVAFRGFILNCVNISILTYFNLLLHIFFLYFLVHFTGQNADSTLAFISV